MLVLYGRLTFQPACVFRGLNKGLNCVWLSLRYTARGTQQPVPEGTTHIPRVRARIRSRMYGFAKSHPEGLATRTKLRLLSERPSQAQGPQSSARRRSTRNPLPSSDKSAGRILKCPKDGALSSSPASPPSPACTRRDVPHRGRVYPGCCGLTAASPTSCSPNQDAGQDQDARRLAGLQSPSQETAELDAVHCLLPVGWGKCRFPAQRKDISFISFVFISCPTTANLREISSPRHSMLKFRPFPCKETRCPPCWTRHRAGLPCLA